MDSDLESIRTRRIIVKYSVKSNDVVLFAVSVFAKKKKKIIKNRPQVVKVFS